MPESVTHVESSAFHSCPYLESVTWSPNLTHIGELAFAFCNFKTVDLPTQIENIGFRAFYGNKIGALVLNCNHKTIIETGAFAGNDITELEIGVIKTIRDRAFDSNPIPIENDTRVFHLTLTNDNIVFEGQPFGDCRIQVITGGAILATAWGSGTFGLYDLYGYSNYPGTELYEVYTRFGPGTYANPLRGWCRQITAANTFAYPQRLGARQLLEVSYDTYYGFGDQELEFSWHLTGWELAEGGFLGIGDVFLPNVHYKTSIEIEFMPGFTAFGLDPAFRVTSEDPHLIQTEIKLIPSSQQAQFIVLEYHTPDIAPVLPTNSIELTQPLLLATPSPSGIIENNDSYLIHVGWQDYDWDWEGTYICVRSYRFEYDTSPLTQFIENRRYFCIVTVVVKDNAPFLVEELPEDYFELTKGLVVIDYSEVLLKYGVYFEGQYIGQHSKKLGVFFEALEPIPITENPLAGINWTMPDANNEWGWQQLPYDYSQYTISGHSIFPSYDYRPDEYTIYTATYRISCKSGWGLNGITGGFFSSDAGVSVVYSVAETEALNATVDKEYAWKVGYIHVTFPSTGGRT
jgi:hypothetical protein